MQQQCTLGAPTLMAVSHAGWWWPRLRWPPCSQSACLCGAELLSGLLAVTGETLEIPSSEFWGWCDNTTVIAWLRGCPSNYRTFVANRVASAARNVPPSVWHYVPTGDSPADCASRGISAQELLQHHLWWSGPPWLNEYPVAVLPQPGASELDRQKTEEAKPVAIFSVTSAADTGWEKKHTNYVMLLHSTAYVLRFLHNLKAAIQGQPGRRTQGLSVAEVEAAELLLFQRSQARAYAAEIKGLSADATTPMDKGSKLRLVHPYINDKGLLAVGGRLGKSNLSLLAKNPVILSPSDIVTKLYFVYNHILLSHCGPTLLLAHTGQAVYVSAAKKLARTTCQNCIICKKAAPRRQTQLMAPLPSTRVTKVFPFILTGVDFAGPST